MLDLGANAGFELLDVLGQSVHGSGSVTTPSLH